MPVSELAAGQHVMHAIVLCVYVRADLICDMALIPECCSGLPQSSRNYISSCTMIVYHVIQQLLLELLQ